MLIAKSTGPRTAASSIIGSCVLKKHAVRETEAIQLSTGSDAHLCCNGLQLLK